MTKLPIAFLVSVAINPQLSKAGECSQLDAYAAETVVDYLDSWDNVHLAYKQFPHCDDGGVAEGYSDRIVHLLATNWASFPQLVTYFDKEPNFRKFIFSHIDATANSDELKIISNLTLSRCPVGFGPLCDELGLATAKALEELKAIPHAP